MSKVQEYLKNKEFKEKYPLIYVVKSTKSGVLNVNPHQVIDIKEGVAFRGNERTRIDRYKISESPYEIDIALGENFTIDNGFGSGFGDLWEWSFFSSLDENEANEYFEKETKRVYNEYSIKQTLKDLMISLNHQGVITSIKYDKERARTYLDLDTQAKSELHLYEDGIIRGRYKYEKNIDLSLDIDLIITNLCLEFNKALCGRDFFNKDWENICKLKNIKINYEYL